MTSLPETPVVLTWQTVFGQGSGEIYLTLDDWTAPVQFFVGRNGSGKSRAALQVVQAIRHELSSHWPGQQRPIVRYLRPDRMIAFQTMGHFGGGFHGPSQRFQGVPLDPAGAEAGKQLADTQGMASDTFYALREWPNVGVRVAASLSAWFGRDIELPQVSGFLDPVIRFNESKYSLLNEEGHGLRELIALLVAVYRPDWRVLVVDEPELHLHPSLTRLWYSELDAMCRDTGRRAIIVTHEPRLIAPVNLIDLRSIWLFSPGAAPKLIADGIGLAQQRSIEGDLTQNPALVSDLVFSPRPVLVEGPTDRAALETASARLLDAGSRLQTDYIPCGGVVGVARWFEIGKGLGVDVRAIVDLDGLFDPAVGRVLDTDPIMRRTYRSQWQAKGTAELLRPIRQAAKHEGVKGSAGLRSWLADRLMRNSEDRATLRASQLIDAARAAGLWLHRPGDLESVLGLSAKDVIQARRAATDACALDEVVEWASKQVDRDDAVRRIVRLEVERLASEVQRNALAMGALRSDSLAREPGEHEIVVGALAANGKYRLEVRWPDELSGYWVEFDRHTSPHEMDLRPPES